MKEINKYEVGSRIRLLRSQKGWTLIDLASKLDEVLPIKYNKHGEVITLSDSIISRWENGISLPNKERQKAISEVLDVPLEELLYGKNDNYIDSLIESFKTELQENKSIKNKLIPFITSQMESILKSHAQFMEATSIERINSVFNSSKKPLLEIWSNPGDIEFQLLDYIDKTLRGSIQDTVPYFYEDFLNDSDEISDKRITSDSQLYIRRLQELADFISAYMDAIRFKDNEDIQKELDKLKEFQKTIDQRMLS
ncbi:Helix-turn-helix domain protein [Streptococcus parauberis]|uniref:helix-turn-helix domain-containing protein n=1 Tax=Streptococcus parauberis TaxID=1348 RepID=UPI000CCEB5CD|nr:helix-turn-helix transcriptional regulator [Streptococcus parauberis]PNY20532.1 Helix-turn-helix domain protein [Streptococcus parauberis]